MPRRTGRKDSPPSSIEIKTRLADTNQSPSLAHQLAPTIDWLAGDHASLFDLVHDSVMITSLDGTICYWNTGSERLYGYSKDEAVGQNSYQLLQDEFPEDLSGIISFLLAHDYWEGELTHKAKDGHPITVLSRWTLKRDQHQQPQQILKIHTDVSARRTIEDELRHYRAMVEASSEVIISRSLDGTILSWNKAAEELYGYTAAEMVGQKADILFPPGQEKNFEELNRRLETDTTVFFPESQRVTRDGRVLDLEVSFSPLHDQTGRLIGAMSITRDISARKQAEYEHERLAAAEAAKEEAQRLNQRLKLLDQASQGFLESHDTDQILTGIAKAAVPTLADWSVVHVVQSDGTLHRVTSAYADPRLSSVADELDRQHRIASLHQLPPSHCQLFAASQPTLTNRITKTWYHQVSRNAEHEKLLRQLDPIAVLAIPLRVSEQVQATITLMRLRGSRRYHRLDFLLAQELSRRATIVLDRARMYQLAKLENAERMQAQEALHRSEERYRMFIAQSSEGIWRFEARRPINISQATDLQVLQLLNELFVAECNEAMALMHGFQHSEEMVGQPLRRFLQADNLEHRRFLLTLISQDYRVQNFEMTEDRQDRRYYFRKSAIGIIEDGCLVRCWGTQQDITASKRLERQKDEFLGIASHELKTPVTSLKAFTQILHRKISHSQPEATVYLQKMDGQINRLTSLINELLDVTKIQSGKLEFHLTKTDFGQVLTEVVEDFQHTAEQHRIELGPLPTIMVLADRDRLGQLVINLLSNAVKYSPDANRVKVWVKRGQREVKLYVQDYGIGITKEDQEHIFERFYRSRPPGGSIGGLGLGLYISSEIALRHHGTLTVKSRVGHGSTFCLTLPLMIA